MQGYACVSVGVCFVCTPSTTCSPLWQFCHSIAPAVFASCCAFAALFTTQIEIVIHSLNLSSWPRECTRPPLPFLTLPTFSSHFLSSLTRTYLGIFKLGYTHTHVYTYTSYATIRCFCHFQFEIAAAAAPLTRPHPLFFHLVETTSN